MNKRAACMKVCFLHSVGATYQVPICDYWRPSADEPSFLPSMLSARISLRRDPVFREALVNAFCCQVVSNFPSQVVSNLSSRVNTLWRS